MPSWAQLTMLQALILLNMISDVWYGKHVIYPVRALYAYVYAANWVEKSEFKTTLLALAFGKRVGDLQALSVNIACI